MKFYTVRKVWFQVLVGLLFFVQGVSGQIMWNPGFSVGTASGVYSYSYSQTPDQLIELNPAAIPNTGLTYVWQSCATPLGTFATAAGTATSSGYTFSGPLTQTMYYRRMTTSVTLGTIYSNTVKISVVSASWEDLNYVREHEVLTTGVTSWTAVDQLAIGSKLQTTNYFDGLGRTTQKVSRETATPPSGTLWGDMVQFAQYDGMGRAPLKYLPYTTTSESGKYKTAPLTEQPLYYSNLYNESSAYTSISFDNSPLNRVTTVKQSGTSWAAGAGNKVGYDMNDAADNVQIFTVDYVQGDAPVGGGAYAANTLYKLGYTDVNGKQVIEYTNKSGQLILKKVQVDNTPGAAHDGWICTYNVYDDFGLLRFQLQPEAVKYLDGHGWSFAGTDGSQVLNEYCFQYDYDSKGRLIWKKAPGALPLNMLYDARDRLVFTQDGNQRTSDIPQWTANLYDQLDRPIVTTLYNTSATVSTLQASINAAAALTTITIANAGTSSVTINSSLNPITSANLNNTSVCTVLKYLFYDEYSFPLKKNFNTTSTNTNAYSTSDPNVYPLATSLRVLSLPLGNMTRVLGGTKFLAATTYYDEKGHRIQTLEDNIKTGVDIVTLQYHFDDRLLSTCSDHTTASTGYTNYKILTKYNFDKIGRVSSIQKQYGSNAMKTISSFDFDDMGRVKTKHLDPGYSNLTTGLSELESLNYSFNIHNQLTGINQDYAKKTSGLYDKWGHYFGMYLGFDNRDNFFTAAQLNGQVGGVAWNTQGDDAQRRYNYSYDNASRLANAAFTEQQHPGDGWSNGKMDFSVSGTSGQITYDLNGNILTMLQKGVMPGTSTPFTVDDLSYSYATLSNKLQSVSDQMTATSLNGISGDFKDGSNGSSPDYVYDANGNVIVDLNKNVQSINGLPPGTIGINYNYLDKPEAIRIVGKGSVRIVYSADGEKLQRTFIPEAGGSSLITTYINEFVYTESASITTTTPTPLGGAPSLAYINFEEGRVRVMTPVSQDNGNDALSENGNITLPNSKSGAFDYFIMDYQQNVRMILTEETHSAGNTATMETTRASVEEPVFGQTGAANEVATTRYTKPAGWTGNATASVSRLGNLAGKNIGPNTLQKVMAGDRVSAMTDYYYQSGAGSSNPNMVTAVLGSLIQGINGGAAAGSLVKANSAGINTELGGNVGFANAVQPAGVGGSTPEAYLTILFFDERFNLVPAADGGVVQSQVASSVTGSGAQLAQLNIKAPKNGYVYAYLSNRSDQDVYFDNFKVAVATSNIIEENHYYAYGLRIASISSRKLPDANEGNIKNTYFYNDKELFEDGELNWYDYGFRNYDPQIGRFAQLDPLTDEFPFLTPYQYASNDPITNIDLDGLEGLSTTADKAITLGDIAIRYVRPAASSVTSASNIYKSTKLALSAIQVAAIVVRVQIANKTLNQGISSQAVIGQLKIAMDQFVSQHLELNESDIFTLGVKARNYLKGLNLMAWWSKKDFIELDKEAINHDGSDLSDLDRVQIVESALDDNQSGVFSILSSGAETGLFISSVGLFPSVGPKPRGSMLKFRTLPPVPKGRMVANDLKEFKKLIRSLSRSTMNDRPLTAQELEELKKLTEKFGGRLRYDLRPVKGKILKPHVQVEKLGSQVGSRHIYIEP